MTVPIAVNTAADIVEELKAFLTTKNKPKNKNAEIGLSIIFAICPPGNPVVNAEMTPVVIPSSTMFFTEGNNIMPKNIIVSNISGFIPNKRGGTMVCNTAPIPTNNDNDTSTFVFTSHLSSSILNSFFINLPTVLSTPIA